MNAREIYDEILLDFENQIERYGKADVLTCPKYGLEKVTTGRTLPLVYRLDDQKNGMITVEWGFGMEAKDMEEDDYALNVYLFIEGELEDSKQFRNLRI